MEWVVIRTVENRHDKAPMKWVKMFQKEYRQPWDFKHKPHDDELYTYNLYEKLQVVSYTNESYTCTQQMPQQHQHHTWSLPWSPPTRTAM